LECPAAARVHRGHRDHRVPVFLVEQVLPADTGTSLHPPVSVALLIHFLGGLGRVGTRTFIALSQVLGGRGKQLHVPVHAKMKLYELYPTLIFFGVEYVVLLDGIVGRACLDRVAQ
jgi:hypothetical protein